MRFGALCFVLAIPAASVSQQHHACDASPELLKFYSEIKDSSKRADILRARLEVEPDNFFLHRWFLESPQIRTGSLNQEYWRILERHPNDVRYVYLYGRALMGADTPKAIEYLNRAVDKDPRSPWGYFSLLEVYASPNFRNPGKLGKNLLAFTERCQDSLDVFKYLRHVDDKEQLRVLARRLRRLLETSGATGSGSYYAVLWGAEFRAADARDYEAVRAKITEDLTQVKKIDPANTDALAQGYKLIGDTDAANALARRPEADSEVRRFSGVFSAWSKEHPYPKRDAPAEQQEQFNQARLKVSQQWLKEWPDEPQAHYWHFISVSAVKSAGRQELEKAGEALLEMAARRPNTWSAHPYSLTVAHEWNRHDIRLADCIRLAGEAIAGLDRGPGAGNDMHRGSQSEALKMMAYNIALSRFNALEVQAEAYRKLKDFAMAGTVIRKMQEWLQNNPGDFPLLDWTYMVQRARLAEAEGRNLDALGYYQRALHRLDHSPEVRERALTLWEAQGGSKEAFEAWASRTPARPSVANVANVTWSKVNAPLTALHASDLAGKTWTIADLKGKTTFINVWATWCGPCLTELPQLQTLFNLVKDRKDVRVITISVDENPGLLSPFMQKNQYTFPVLLARSLVDEVAPSFSIPRNWIVDRDGNLRLESIGFDSRSENWPQQMLQKLARPIE